ncbi:uncharacterized protein LOC101847532 [Aplysia californica]|uniref:Uncharacterized protein LOC101847532 n=1 Tax=Aplysia californica TaxID=6500 RepID=A0ABM0K619_APLCA|nr:uncharacterized protein LOC101847532 [Aplysia californica]XP_005109562.1 uncharacterized protein LOC101847532 [Aplysia californica]
MAADIDAGLLISLVKGRPPLWNKLHEDYKSRVCTSQGWKEVCRGLNQGYDRLSFINKTKYEELVKKKWKNVKDQYIKALKRRKGRQNSKGKSKKNYIYHAQLSFLKRNMEVDAGEESESSIKVEANESPEEQEEGNGETQESPSDNETIPVSVFVSDPVTSVVSNPVTVLDEPSRKRRKDNNYEIEIVDHLSPREDRHLFFFKGLLPSLLEFSDDETLKFQSSVINVIQGIKRARLLPQ